MKRKTSDLFSRSVLVALLANLPFTANAEVEDRTHVECAVSKECVDGTCTEIDPLPLLLRFVRATSGLQISVYGSNKLLGGQPADNNAAVNFGVIVNNAVTSRALAGDYGLSEGAFWVNLKDPDDKDLRFWVGAAVSKSVAGKSVTTGQLLPVLPMRADGMQSEVRDGHVAECVWHLQFGSYSTPSDREIDYG